MGSAFLPTRELLRDIANALDLEPNDPAVTAAFDQLVLRGQLVPFVPDWWELMGWLPGELERVVAPLAPHPLKLQTHSSFQDLLYLESDDVDGGEGVQLQPRQQRQADDRLRPKPADRPRRNVG